jgi:hypothetical protein
MLNANNVDIWRRGGRNMNQDFLNCEMVDGHPNYSKPFQVSKKEETMYLIKISRVPKDPQEATKAVQDWIFPSTSKPGSVSPSVSPEPE